MKTNTFALLASIFATTSIVGCGQELSQGSDLSARNPSSTETVIEDVSMHAIPGGFNPNFVAWAVEGRVQIGGNRCQSQGVTVQVTQETVNDELQVIVKLRKPRNSGERICTREFMPQYKNVKFDVRYDSSRITRAVLHNVDMFDRDIEVGSMAVVREPVVVSNVTVEQLMTTMHHDRIALRISADVESGSNPCFAGLSKTSFESRKVGDRIQLVAIRQHAKTDTMCTMEYNPQTERISIDLEIGLTERLEIFNVEEMGETLYPSAL